MVSGRFGAAINRAVDALRAVDLLADLNEFPDLSVLAPSLVRSSTYLAIWTRANETRSYHIKLVNEGLLVFREGQGECDTFVYLDPPIAYVSLADYCKKYLDEPYESYASDADTLGVLESDYREFLSSRDFDQPVTPIRYDFSPHQYCAPGHPAAHLHIGYSSSIRIATRRRWSPEAFVLFVIRQFFPDAWGKLLASSDHRIICAAVRTNLDEVGAELWGQLDDAEAFLC